MVNDSLGGLQFGVDENGNYGYIKVGADTVTPFRSKIEAVSSELASGAASGSKEISIPKGVNKVLIIANLYNTCNISITGDVSVISSNFFNPYTASSGSYMVKYYEVEILSGESFTFTWSKGNAGGGTKICVIY